MSRKAHGACVELGKGEQLQGGELQGGELQPRAGASA